MNIFSNEILYSITNTFLLPLTLSLITALAKWVFSLKKKLHIVVRTYPLVSQSDSKEKNTVWYGKDLAHLYRTVITVWSIGKKTICKEDLANGVMAIKPLNGYKIIKAFVIKQTKKEINEFSITHNPQISPNANIDFKTINRKSGAVFEIFHTGDNVEVVTELKDGAKIKMENNTDYKSFPSSLLIYALIMLIMPFFLFYLAFISWYVLHFHDFSQIGTPIPENWWSTLNIIAMLLTLFVSILVFSFLILIIREYRIPKPLRLDNN